MMLPLVVVGASGFGRQTLDVVIAHNEANNDAQFDVLGVLDDNPSEINLERLDQRGIRYLGTVATFVADNEPQNYVVAIGSPSVRAKLVEMLDGAGWRAVTLVHPTAIIGTLQEWGEGTVVCGGTHFSPNVKLGRHVHVNPNSAIGHDSILKDFVSVNLAASISGNTTVGARTLIGGGSFILQDLEVGEDVTVGAGAVVTRPVESGHTVVGVPARVMEKPRLEIP